MKILLLGANGQLGQQLQKQLLWRQFNTLALSRQQLDITDITALSGVLKAFQPNIVINCAAYTKVDAAELNKTQCTDINFVAVKYLAQWCASHQALIVHFSTDYVFDGRKNCSYTETDETAPINHYGKTKLLAEQAIQLYCQKYLILRTSWLFSLNADGFFSTMWQKALTGEATYVIKDQIGSPTPSRALAEAVLAVLAKYAKSGYLPYGLYHYAGYPGCSWFEFATAIFSMVAPEHVKCLHAIASPYVNAIALRPSYSSLNCNAFQQRFMLSPPNWQDEITRCVKNKLSPLRLNR